MLDLYVIAAGKGTRLGLDIPKPLVEIHNKPVVQHTVDLFEQYFDRIFIVTNINHDWGSFFKRQPKNVRQISINSGLGDGHAIFKAFEHVTDTTEAVVCWGDVYFNQPQIMWQLLDQKIGDNSALIPCVNEKDPYVCFNVDKDMNCTGVDFSKFGESNSYGFHDQCLFRVKKDLYYDSLSLLHSAMWKTDKYLHNNELNFLHTFHLMYNIDQPAKVYETQYSVQTFNTLEELDLIK